MNAIFDKMNKSQFNLLSIFIPIISDVYICFYLFKKFIDKEMFEKTLGTAFSLVEKSNPSIMSQGVPDNFTAQLWDTYLTSFWGLMAFYLILHGITFLLSYKGKKLATSYVYLYSASASLLMLVFSIFTKASWFNLGFFILGILHLINVMGFKYFKKSEE